MPKQIYFLFIFFFAFTSVLLTADDPAKGHYESALFFLKNQKIQQALEDLTLITKSFPQSPYADDAMLQLGKYYFDQKQFDQALNYFQQIKERYTGSDSAPAAYCYMGEINLLKLDPASLEEALADFQRVSRVFPSSDWVDRSLVGAGRVLEWRGEFDKAYNEFERVKVRFADSPVAARAQYEMGICALYGNQILEAMTAFQRVVQHYPDSEYSKGALELNTILYRLHIAPQADKKVYALDSSYNATILDLDDPSGMSIDSRQNVYLSDRGKKAVYVFDAGGKMSTTMTLTDPRAIYIDKQDHTFIANDTSIVVDGKDVLSFPNPTGKPVPLEEIRSVAVDQSGKYFVISNKLPGIFVFDQKKTLLSDYSLTRTERQYYKVLVNSRNQICALDKDRKQIGVYAPDGKFLFAIGPSGKGYTVEKIEDFAVDHANHFYLLEKNPRSVLIFSPSGELMRYIVSDKKGTITFEDARLITVGPSGAIYLLDKDQHKILKIG